MATDSFTAAFPIIGDQVWFSAKWSTPTQGNYLLPMAQKNSDLLI
jgi:hypothetical protein